MDLRTWEGREAEIIDQVRCYGGFTVFWITENRLRAHVATKLHDSGMLVTEPAVFPWIKAAISRSPAQMICADRSERREP